MRRRGFVFTLDALLSLILVVVFVSGMVAIIDNTNVYTTSLREGSKYKAEDVLTTLRNVPLKELVPPEILENWSNSGVLDEPLVTPDMSPLDIIATYWATRDLFPEKNLTHKAELILGYLLNKTLEGYYYELLINNYTSSYLRKVGGDYSKAFEVSPATLTLSGYKYNQTPRGYMARAYLTRATVEREELYGWFRVLAGADDGYNVLNITRVISLPMDATPISADGKFVSRREERIDVYINNSWISRSYGQVNLNNLEDYLGKGDNIISLVFSRGSDEIGSASGTTLYIKYNSSSFSVEDPGMVKVYDVTSDRTGIMYLFETFVPGNITSINMKFEIYNIGKVRLYYGFGGDLTLLYEKDGNTNGNATIEFTDSEIKSALSNIGVTYENLSKMVFDFVVGFDAYYDDGNWYYEGDDYNDGANRERRIYGYPDSYVKIDYIPKILTTQYSIPLSVYFPYGDPRVTYDGSGLQVRYSLPENTTAWYADFWVGYRFVGYSTYQELWENDQMFYRGPLGRYAIRVAYTRLYDWMMVPGQENTFEIRMTGGSSYVRDGETRGIIKYFIQGYAGYGDVFPYLLQGYSTYRGYNLTYYYNGSSRIVEKNILVGDPPYRSISIDDLNPDTERGYAVDDAILRLFDKLNYREDSNPGEWRETPFDGSQSNPIDVDLSEEVKISFVDMGEIPGLFEPVQITLRVWRED
ncbi:hypothetical protein OCC_01569 [Thermococcus litoralis DSM 5473]|jgi:hypothetical protein|uniref:Uncharacterized protein n=1 Tax=Thermococcus litoralis (strain ATCC 51850 / DSM 5473 / JCM 8560 / NS-C) TaxID=523849 RepID=H3ZLN9_THELN|nr:hypothetical protein [Thermococcus litoralis]EHR79177.1 hypothetical protein OCC_01569 [Thermococcus litoralis DSM 5473]MDK2782430.1 hypothetical protein [Thermococcaceae archaeon]